MSISVRKEIKIRPGFTPQEDVGRFRGSRQQAADRTVLPKGHIVGWTPPSESTTKPKPKPGSLAAVAAAAAADTAGMSKAQKKNAKRAEKRAEKRQQPTVVKENWDDDDEDEADEDEQGKVGGAGVDLTSDSKTDPIDAVTKEIGELKV
jgi:partner of Y14 and mago protein